MSDRLLADEHAVEVVLAEAGGGPGRPRDLDPPGPAGRRRRRAARLHRGDLWLVRDQGDRGGDRPPRLRADGPREGRRRLHDGLRLPGLRQAARARALASRWRKPVSVEAWFGLASSAVDIRVIDDVALKDDALMREFYDLERRSELHGRPHSPHWDFEEFLGAFRSPDSGERAELFAAYDGDPMVGTPPCARSSSTTPTRPGPTSTWTSPSGGAASAGAGRARRADRAGRRPDAAAGRRAPAVRRP